jgi:hypothetical protein
MPSKPPYDQIFEFYLNPVVYERRLFAKKAVFGSNVFSRLKSLLVSLLGNLYKSIVHRPVDDAGLKGKRWIVVGTRNQESATDFLVDDGFQLVAANFYESAGTSGKVNWYLLPKMAYLPKYLPFLIRAFYRNPAHFMRVFQELVHGVGVYENQLKVLAKYEPEVLVLSNDHLPWFRALTLAARVHGIPTVYLQHAPVSIDFPSLLFDLSLLEGQDAWDKYHRPGLPVHGKVRIIGMPRYDPFSRRVNVSGKAQKIGIAYSLADDVDMVGKVVATLSEAFPQLMLTVRKHPRDERELLLPAIQNIVISNSREVKALDFLLDQDVVLAGETGIHLEAAMMNVSTLYFRFFNDDQPPTDAYGFLQRALMPQVDTVEELVVLLEGLVVSRPAVREAASYYVANLEGEWAGSVQTLALQEIEQLLTEQ